jgi:signal transduction histidine kinase
LMWLLYRYRVHQLAKEFNIRVEERVGERTRIAQDLHDTLLQGFLSASMQLHVAERQIPSDSPAKPLVGRVLELMSQVIEEGRTTLRGLRSTNTNSRDLALSFSSMQEELATYEQVNYRVTVEGTSRPLHPSVRDEIYLIGREALLNAFRHSKANTVEVELEYGIKQLRILVRDDGRGIEPEVLAAGRQSHWGISGMRERAEEMGASLKLFSRDGAGTEVELSVPGRIAYESNSSQRSRHWFSRLFRGGTDSNGSEKS